jgi:hypothetical protein
MQGVLKRYQTAPELGSSIGVTGDKRSFSLGFYLHFDGDEKQYSLSVHHGLSHLNVPISPSTTLSVTVQQPSKSDHGAVRDEHVNDLNACIEGSVRKRHPTSYWEEELERHDGIDTNFGTVTHSEGTIIEYEGRRIWSDWSIIETTRTGENRFTSPQTNRTRWFPRDSCRLYVAGTGKLVVGSRIIKLGRSTGTTESSISFVCDKCQFEGTDLITEEYSAYSLPGHPLPFSNHGDSGGPVIDDNGMAVGMIVGGTDGNPKAIEGHESLGAITLHYISPLMPILERIALATGREPHIDIPDLAAVENGGTKIYRGRDDLD